MREIKFRVWDDVNKKFGFKSEYSRLIFDLLDSTVGITDVCGIRNPPENKFILEQYTGLKDATTWEELTEKERSEWTRDGNLPSEWEGKEIYEGDILFIESCFDSETFKVPVIYKDGCFQAEGSGILSFVCLLNTPKIKSNIHENKDKS